MSNDLLKQKKRLIYKGIRSKAVNKSGIDIYLEVEKYLYKRIINEEIKGYVGSYWPLKGEVDLLKIKQIPKLKLSLPKSYKDGRLNYYPWSSNSLSNDEWGIPAPSEDNPPLRAKDMSLLLVPGLAIDKSGYRLGYGGGYFDRLRALRDWRSVPAVVILPKECFSSQSLPRDKWDIPFDTWINQDGESPLEN